IDISGQSSDLLLDLSAEEPFRNPVEQKHSPGSSSNEWIPLFNGKDLDNWYFITRDTNFQGSKASIFAIEQDMIHVYPTQENLSTQTFASLTTKKSYSHFRLKLEYKWGDHKFKPREKSVRDAGIIFHVHGADIIWPNGVECQIQEGDTGDIWAIGTRVSSPISDVIRNYSAQGSLATRGRPEKRFSRFHRGYCWEKPEWNLVELEVRGDHAIFKVNGNIVNEAIDMQTYNPEINNYQPLTAGKILIQAEGAELYYRNIYIQELR
ncbi:MAG: DUF1080 domain-containing protein, partial [Bacteroidota bacterium]